MEVQLAVLNSDSVMKQMHQQSARASAIKKRCNCVYSKHNSGPMPTIKTAVNW